jgi:hypothetical protein
MLTVWLSADTLFIEYRFMPRATLDKLSFVECQINSSQLRARHSAKNHILIVVYCILDQSTFSPMILSPVINNIHDVTTSI